MSKYDPLSERLAAETGDEWPATFAELEAVLGVPLPKGARAGRAWWANDPSKRHSRAWAAHGWEVGDVDHAAERVVFRRGAASGATLAAAAGLQPLQEPAGEVQPPTSEAATEPVSARRGGMGKAALVTAGVAVVAGLGALITRAVLRRSK